MSKFIKNNYDRSVSLICPICAGVDFDGEGEAGNLYKCTSCAYETTYDELVAQNGDRIEREVEDIKREVSRDIEKELSKTLKNAFRGSKFIKFK